VKKKKKREMNDIEELLIEAGYIEDPNIKQIGEEIDEKSGDKQKTNENRIRCIQYLSVKFCPVCGKDDIIKYHDISNDRYHMYCRNLPPYMRKELEEQKQADTKDRKTLSKAKQICVAPNAPKKRKTKQKTSDNVNFPFIQTCPWHVSI
jgi:hypothetical protein